MFVPSVTIELIARKFYNINLHVTIKPVTLESFHFTIKQLSLSFRSKPWS